MNVKAIQKKYGFSYQGYRPSDREWGNIKNINGTTRWSGMIGKVR